MKESVWFEAALAEKVFGAPDRLATVGTGKHSVISLVNNITCIVVLTFLMICRTRHVRNDVHYVLGVRLGQSG